MSTCYCGSSESYSNCCEPYHTASKLAQTAQILMRSRFSAFVVKNEAYLLATWDESKRPVSFDFSSEVVNWQRLEIIRCNKGRENHNQGTVEFKAYYQQDGENLVLHEISRFTKKQGEWLYIDGAFKVSENSFTYQSR